MRIGELANKAQVNIQTLRFYERRGLLPRPARTLSGYRNYGQSDLEKVLFIKWCQHLGFTLKEVDQLLELHLAVAKLPPVQSRRKRRELNSIVHLAEEKLANVHEKITLLKTMGKQLRSMIEKLQADPQPVCPASVQVVKSSKSRHRLPRRRKTA